MKIAILGLGEMGQTVIGHLQACKDVTALVGFDIDPSKVEAVQKKFAVPGVTNLDAILDDRDIPLVFITASNGAHADLALEAIRAGKAVMLEKPIATTLKDARAVVAAAEESGSFLQVGFELRYSKLYTVVKDWIDEGLLGEIVNVHGNYICSEFHGKGSWRNQINTGGSMFGEKLSHYVDLPRWWTGSEVTEIHAVCAPNVVPYFEVHDNYHTICRFQNGAVSHLTFMMYVASEFAGDPLQNHVTQQMDDGHELKFLVVGRLGAAEADVFKRRIRRWHFADTPTNMVSKLVETHTWEGSEDDFYFHNTEHQAHDIVNRVLKGLPPKTAARDSLMTMEVCEGAELSAAENRPINILEIFGS